MTNFLEYRPHLEYKRRLQAVLQQQEEPFEEHGDYDILGPPKPLPSEQLQRNGYVPSEAIKETVDLTSTDMLMSLGEAKAKIDAFINKIVNKLRKDVTIKPTIDEYIKARDENDTDIIYEFEDFHSREIEGSTEAELLPLLYRFEKELDAIGDFIGSYLFPDELAHDLGYLLDQIERLRREEEDAIKDLIQQDIDIRLDEDRLKERNHILQFIHDRAEGLGDFVDEADSVISVTPMDTYYNSGSRIAILAVQQETLHREFHKLNQKRFSKQADNTEDAATRMTRLVDYSYKVTILENLVALQEEKLESRDALTAMYLVNPSEEDDMLNTFLSDMVEEIQEVKTLSDSLVEDLYKITDLEALQGVDYLSSLNNKHACRQLHSLFERIQEVDADAKDLEKEITKLFS